MLANQKAACTARETAVLKYTILHAIRNTNKIS